MRHINKLKNGVVIVAAFIFAGLLVKEWFDVRAEDAAEAKSGHAQPKPISGFSPTKLFGLDTYAAQQQFFDRWDNSELYVPDPMVEKLDIDDNVIRIKYREQSRLFTKKLDEMHVDINTVLVKPNPAPIRFVSVEEKDPVHLWHLFLLTGNDTAQLLEDGIHLRRQGFPEQILGGHVKYDDRRLHGEMGTILWKRDAAGRWRVDQNTSSWIWQISATTVDEIKKHENLGPCVSRGL